MVLGLSLSLITQPPLGGGAGGETGGGFYLRPDGTSFILRSDGVSFFKRP